MEQEFLQTFKSLCDKLAKLIDASTDRIAELEDKVRELEGLQGDALTQAEASRKTGWSVSAINNWLKDGTIIGVPIPGRKTIGIPYSEVQRLRRRKENAKLSAS